MDRAAELILSYYETVGPVNDAHGTFLVRHRETGKLFVKKVLSVYDPRVYGELKTHPVRGVPKVEEYYEDGNRLILIEEYIRGRSLADILESGGVDVPRAIRCAADVCGILTGLHRLEPPVIHRDIKPANVIITDGDRPVLIDLNAAKQYSPTAVRDTTMLGTVGYAAPEQFGFGASSPQTDIYGVGRLLREMTESAPSVPAWLEDVMTKCTRLETGERYMTAEGLKRELETRGRVKETKQAAYRKYLPPGFRSGTL